MKDMRAMRGERWSDLREGELEHGGLRDAVRAEHVVVLELTVVADQCVVPSRGRHCHFD
jgi:hypothetical protein